jgi:elongation factor P
MDVDNFEQITLAAELLGDALNYVTEGMSLDVVLYRDEPVGVDLPPAVELRVIEAGPGFKGDTATAGNKPATMETGITVQVPLFINTGDVIKVDTRDGSYLERVS